MKPEIWGPSMWNIIHTISFEYPNNPTTEDKQKHVDFILNLQFILPCKECRNHLSEILRNMKFNISHMKNKYTFSKFCVDLHNTVNKRLGKPIIPYQNVYMYYNKLN